LNSERRGGGIGAGAIRQVWFALLVLDFAVQRIILGLAGLNGFAAVAAGAFGAHGLKSSVGTEALTVFETAARYHMYHALALVAIALLMRYESSRALTAAAVCMQLGIVFFSGSLYAMGLSDLRWKWLGPITPIGGGLFLVGWLLIAVAGFSVMHSEVTPNP
jgi:uncharacterized membrane protein YgdD (TMEM256/DUF423 family)